MIARRSLLILLPVIAVVAGSRAALAKNHHHNNGHQLLGAKINTNGKHTIGKVGQHDLVAEVANKKVLNMTAGNLPVHKVKSSQRMVSRDSPILPVAASAGSQFAQVVVGEVWYAYCFDDGLDEYCYWFPAADVVVTDGWVEYVPV
jgi:hypothetical protein